MPDKEYPSFDYVRQCLEYRDGLLFWTARERNHFSCDMVWNKWGTIYAGKEAGHTAWFGREGQKQERCVIILDQFRRYRYQFVWAIFNNEWADEIDHKDVNSLNDRIENLRAATRGQNSANTRLRKDNTSGLKGIRWKKDRSKWQARIVVNGKEEHIGYYLTKEEAEIAREIRAKECFGEFYRKE